MDFVISKATPVLKRTPKVLKALLAGLPDVWLNATEGPDTWNPQQILGHIIHGEKTDLIPRVEWILAHGDKDPFPPFDREGMLKEQGRPLKEMLEEFATLRAEGVAKLKAYKFKKSDLKKKGRHPEFGPVTLGQHLATWVAHDLSHITQILRVMGKQYKDAVGPWLKYLPFVETPAGRT